MDDQRQHNVNVNVNVNEHVNVNADTPEREEKNSREMLAYFRTRYPACHDRTTEITHVENMISCGGGHSIKTGVGDSTAGYPAALFAFRSC